MMEQTRSLLAFAAMITVVSHSCIALLSHIISLNQTSLESTSKDCANPGTVYWIRRSKTLSLANQSIILGGSNQLYSHAAFNYIYLHKLRSLDPLTNNRGLVESAKNHFVFEVPSSRARYWLYLLRISDHTILPRDLAFKAKEQLPLTHLVPIDILSITTSSLDDKHLNRVSGPAVSLADLHNYMKRNYSDDDYRERQCT